MLRAGSTLHCTRRGPCTFPYQRRENCRTSVPGRTRNPISCLRGLRITFKPNTFGKMLYRSKVLALLPSAQELSSRGSRTYFSISCSRKAHSFLSIAFIIFLLFSNWAVSLSVGRVASQARFSRARSIISTSACPAGRPRPGDEAKTLQKHGDKLMCLPVLNSLHFRSGPLYS